MSNNTDTIQEPFSKQGKKEKKQRLKISALPQTWRRIYIYLKPYRWQFIAALICMALFGASEAGIPFLIRNVLDKVFNDKSRDLLWVMFAALIIFAFIRAALDFGQQFLMAKVGHNVTRDIRNKMNSHLLKMGSDFFLTKSVGDILARFTSDVILVRDILTSSLASIVKDIISIIALLAYAICLDPILASVAFVAFVVGFIPVYRFSRRIRKLSKRGQDAIGSISGLIQETVLGHQIVKIFNREKFEEERFAKENENLTRTFIKSERIRAAIGPLNEVMAIFAIAGVLLFGGFAVMDGGRSSGMFLSFLTSIFLLYAPFKRLSKINNQLQQGISGTDRIYELLNTPPSVQDKGDTIPLGSGNDIVIKDVTFSYAADKAPALKNINMAVEENSRVALVGFSGAGKSTLVALIPRFIDPQSGSIFIGGVNIKDVAIAEVRRRIAMVTQHTFLFNDTIYNNIAYGKEGCTEAEVIQAAKTAYAYDFIMQLPQKFNTVVGESGFSLSGGERQRIAIARAILKDAPILILDEATASLDNRSEREVQAALESLIRQRTTVVIAHRLSTIQTADKIIVMENGTIVEVGTHDELLKRGGCFSKLHALQFKAG
ncbi:MAG: ABC transporter ATP-binding protein [Bdellovibrionota bacterium]